MKYDTATPYAASYLLLKKDGKLAFVLRSNTSWMNGHYGLPSGKVEKNESFTRAAIREGREEIGIELKPTDLRFVHVVDRHDELDWVDMYFEVLSYKGEPTNAEPHIHSELAWLDPDDLPDNVIPSVKAALEAVKANKTFSQFGWS